MNPTDRLLAELRRAGSSVTGLQLANAMRAAGVALRDDGTGAALAHLNLHAKMSAAIFAHPRGDAA